MGQLIVTLIVPPVVGLVTYALVRLLSRGGDDAGDAVQRQRHDADPR